MFVFVMNFVKMMILVLVQSALVRYLFLSYRQEFMIFESICATAI